MTAARDFIFATAVVVFTLAGRALGMTFGDGE